MKIRDAATYAVFTIAAVQSVRGLYGLGHDAIVAMKDRKKK